MREFQVNKYLSLQLENEDTIIYVGGERFRQCKYLLLNIKIDEIQSFDGVESIDEVVAKLDKSQEYSDLKTVQIPPETEFWGHCSNLQVWAEQNYNSKILHKSLSFPLLKRLYELNDPIAIKNFKEEIGLRFVLGISRISIYLIEENYLEYLDREELKLLLQELEKKNYQLYAFVLPMLIDRKYIFQDYPKNEIERIVDKFIIEEETGTFRNLKLNEHLIWIRQQNINKLKIMLKKEEKINQFKS